ncbi:MAG TPA: RDD family protein [Vicinamibacterales bacterium]|nr:RDD family protein [Vicinamibacterales bacterium]
MRLVAGILDGVVIALIGSLWKMSQIDITYNAGQTAATGAKWWTFIVMLAYYIVLEGFGRASLGKLALGLRVRGGGANWWPRIVVRTLVFYVPNAIVALGLWLIGPLSASAPSPDTKFYWNVRDMAELAAAVVVGVLTLALFLTARRRNGWAGLHDLISGTRVVSIAAARGRQTAAVANAAAIAQTAGSALGERTYGPFLTAVDPGDRVHARSIVAFDPVLRRRVWIRTATEGTPAISSERRDLSRVGRLHWLTGRRSPGDNWDAFEAPDGAPFESVCDRPVDWATLKQRLLDLSTELSACAADGTAPILAIDRLWLRGDGRLVLLDFPPPASRADADGTGEPAVLTPSALLSAVVSRCASPLRGAQGGRAPMPLSAHRLVDRLTSATPPPLSEAAKMLADAASTPNRVARRRRAIPIAMAAAPMAFIVTVALLLVPSLTRFLSSPNTEVLPWLDMLNKPAPPGSRLADPEIRRALETYVAGRFASTLHDEGYWSSRMMQGNQQMGQWRRLAADIAARHPSIDAAEVARATTIVAPEIEQQRRNSEKRSGGFAGGVVIIVTTLLLITVSLAVIASAMSSLLVPGGLVTRWLGLAAVTSEGREVGRARSIARTLVAWLPAIVWLGYMAASPKIQGWVPVPSAPVPSTAAMLGILAIGAVWTIVRPFRGPHDLLTRTWVVPR